MIHQLSWRRSNGSHIFFSLVLLLTPIFLNSMEQQEPEIEYKKFLGYYHEELEEMYTRAPEKMKILLKKVRDPLYNKTPQTRAAFFIGEPGTDKTTGAITFAYMLRDTYERELIDCIDFTTRGRGGTTENLKERIEVLLKSQCNKVVIFDEVQELLDHAEDPHYDTASTGRYIKKLLNNNRLNPKLFIIATLNNCNAWADHIKSSMRGRIIKFNGITTPDGKIQALKSRLKLKHITLDPTVDTSFLTNLVKNTQGWTGRDFESFADLIADEHLKSNDSLAHCIATKDTIQEAMHEMREDIKTTSYTKQELDYQQRERHHKQTLKANLLSQWLHRSQKTDGNNVSITIGMEGIGASLGDNASTTKSPSVTKEHLNRIWLTTFPDETPLEFPEDDPHELSSPLTKQHQMQKTTRRHMAEDAFALGACGVVGGPAGMLFGATVGGATGLVFGVVENGFDNCCVQ